MIPTHLRKKKDPDKSYLYAYTEALGMQPDMIPCDSRGNPVGASGESAGGGMRPREAVAQSAELKLALEAIANLKAEIEALKGKQDAPKFVVWDEVEPEAKPKTVDLDDMNRDTLFDYLKRKYGKKAGYLKGNMSKTRLLDEADKLQASADLASLNDTEA